MLSVLYNCTWPSCVFVVWLAAAAAAALLQGRQAEMFWPDDNMWYLIEIHRVNVIDKTATIVYR
jgi:hypothetical protein